MIWFEIYNSATSTKQHKQPIEILNQGYTVLNFFFNHNFKFEHVFHTLYMIAYNAVLY